MKRSPTAFVVALLACTLMAGAEEPKLPEISLSDLSGSIHHLAETTSQRPRAIVFLGTECPVSNGAIPTLNALHRQFSGRADLFGVVSDRSISRQNAVKHFAEFKTAFPVLFDASGTLAASLEPTHVPEAFVFSQSGEVTYRGAIDNAYLEVSRRRANVEKHYLRDATLAGIEGRRPDIARTKPVGCFFESLPAAANQSDHAQVTFTRDIAPLLNSRCVSCHREGQAAPFVLTDYKSAAKRARQMVRVTHKRIMPPWIPKLGAQAGFVGERWLTDVELQLLKTWAESGRAEGNPDDLPPLPKFAGGWELGEPNLVLKMTESFTVPADGPDILQNFVIPIDIPEDKLVRAIQFRPGNERVVHHSVLFLDDKQQARKLDAATPEPGYEMFGGPGFLPSGSLGGWSVGNTARTLPAGMGRYLKKGSDLVMQIHYHPTGKVEEDQSEVGVYFIDRPVQEVLKEPAKLISSGWLADYQIEIPPGEANYRSSASYTLPKDVIMVGVVPHMHLLGKSMKVTATKPDGETITLIDIANWNYNWQDEYYYKVPFKLPAGTRLNAVATFDNSADNPSNPASPPILVSYGDGTLDEMMFCFFLFTAEKVEDVIHVTLDNLAHDLKQPRS